MAGRNIFIDVGGAWGETVREVSGSLWKFDTIYCFEPQKFMASRLKEKFAAEIDSGHVVIMPAGLSNETGKAVLYGEGGSASVFAEKRNVDADKTQTIDLVDTAVFFRDHISDNDTVFMKLNCEGAEGKILTALAESEQLQKITNVMIDFDLRKIRGARREPGKIMRMLSKRGFDRYCLVDDVMLGDTHAHRIRNWLAQVPEVEDICNAPSLVRCEVVKAPLHRRVRRFFRYL